MEHGAMEHGTPLLGLPTDMAGAIRLEAGARGAGFDIARDRDEMNFR
jgi:hypothetical protein